MADDAQFTENASPTLQQLIDYLVDSLFDANKIKQLEHAVRNANAEAGAIVDGIALVAVDPLLEFLAKFFFAIEEHIERIAGPPLARIVGHLLGVEVSTSEIRKRASEGEGSVIGKAVAQLALQALSGPGGELKPGREGAEKLLSMLGQFVVGGWFEGTAFELITTAIPDMDSFESVAELPEKLVGALGLGRLSRIALRPLAQTFVATPLEWELNRAYRPNLLTPAQAAKQFLRGVWTPEQWEEELARQGYSSDRTAAILAQNDQWLSPPEIALLVRQGVFSDDQALDELKNQSYVEYKARRQLQLEDLKRVEKFLSDQADAASASYVRRDIERPAFVEWLSAAGLDDRTAGQVQELAEVRRAVNMQHLSRGDVIDAVKRQILPRAYYRAWLEREGYPDDEVIVLELLLASEIEKDRKIEELRQEALAERAAEKQAKAEAAAKRAAEVEAARALARRGSIADLTRAVVRGLIDITRLEEVLNAQYDADTVSILVGLAEDQRQQYLDEQQRRADALKRAEHRHIDVGAIEQAVLEGVLTIAEFRQRLAMLTFEPADIDVLASTLAARKQDLDDAKKKRSQAEDAAKHKQIDLSRFERLVRLGGRTVADYGALLRQLGFDEPSVAAMVDLLQIQITADRQAAQARADAEAKLHAKGLSLEQFRRAVVLDIRSMGDYQAFLVNQGFTADAIATLMAEARAALDDAEAARKRRQQAGGLGEPRQLSLATVARAASLGIITPAAYQDRLERAGYTADDVTIELELLVTEIADVQAARARAQTLEGDAAARGLSLADVERAVKAGTADLDQYRARARALGYGADDVDLLSHTLEQELLALGDARARRTQIEGELKPRNLSLAQLEAAVKAGFKTVDDYVHDVMALGYGADDAQLLAALLATTLGQAST